LNCDQAYHNHAINAKARYDEFADALVRFENVVR
jgi:hypothetical protein